MMAYGETDARVKPSSRGLHSGCRLVSAAASSSAVSVLEACASQADLRLTLLRPGKEDDEPEQQDRARARGSAVDSGARVLAVSRDQDRGLPARRRSPVNVVDETGTTVASTLLPKPPSTRPWRRGAGNLITWWTGDALMVFDAQQPDLPLHHRRRRAGRPLGPATMMAGELLVPGHRRHRRVRPGHRRRRSRYIAGDPAAERRRRWSRPLRVAVLEQRGDTLVALG